MTADGKRILVMHGDEFDSVVRYAKFLAYLGDWAYGVALEANRAVQRRSGGGMGYSYWSLSAWLKRQVKEAVKAIDRFETALANRRRARAASTGWSAAISIMPRCATSTACAI